MAPFSPSELASHQWFQHKPDARINLSLATTSQLHWCDPRQSLRRRPKMGDKNPKNAQKKDSQKKDAKKK
jgi:hypothetical protein